jgi:tRNA U34 5-methylaminomethyl-2-thiouridine-forming methyltransferase MnmC
LFRPIIFWYIYSLSLLSGNSWLLGRIAKVSIEYQTGRAVLYSIRQDPFVGLNVKKHKDRGKIAMWAVSHFEGQGRLGKKTTFKAFRCLNMPLETLQLLAPAAANRIGVRITCWYHDGFSLLWTEKVLAKMSLIGQLTFYLN